MTTRRIIHLIFSLLLLFFIVYKPAFSLEGLFFTDATTTQEAQVITTALEALEETPTLTTPKQTVEYFMQTMQTLRKNSSNQAVLEKALLALDLSDVNAIVKKERSELLVWELFDILSRLEGKLIFPKKKLSKKEVDWVLYDIGEHQLRLKKYLVKERINTHIEEDTESLDSEGNNKKYTSIEQWLFSAETLENLEAMLVFLKETQKNESAKNNEATPINHVANDKPLALRIVDQVPSELKQSLLGLAFWQWLGILLFILLGMIADAIYRAISTLIMRYFIKNAHRTAYQRLPDDMLRPFGLMVMAFVWWLGLQFLLLPEAALVVLILAVKFLISISGVWGVYRLVDLVNAWFRFRSAQTANKWDDALVPLVRRTLKIFVTVVGLIFIADTLQVNLTGLLAGLGLGGLAFALAAKDIAQNLFGTITILVERTFSVGDWVIIGDVEGTVEDISFRSTRIRTFYDSVVTLPNSNMITSPVDNQGERRYRRLSTKLSLTYETAPDKIEAFCEGVREIIRLHPYMRKDNYQVYFNGYNDSGLDILVYVFWQTPDWATELRERHRFLLDILRLAQALSIDFAYPTQTVYWKTEDNNNPSQETQQTPSETQNKAQSMNNDLIHARQAARSIVSNNLDINKKPMPVTIEKQPLS